MSPPKLMELRPYFYTVYCGDEVWHSLRPTTAAGPMVVYLSPDRLKVRCPRCSYKLDFREPLAASR